jgi:hypothetical protein
MSSLIAAIALQQLRDMEQLQRDFGRRHSRKRRRGITLNSPADHAVTDTQPRRRRSAAPNPKSIMQ